MPRYFEDDDEPRRGRYNDDDEVPRRRGRDDDDAPPRPRRRDDDDYRRPRRSGKSSGTSPLMIILGVLGGVIVVSVVCYAIYDEVTKGTPQAAVAYNEKLVSADKRLADAFVHLDNSVAQCLNRNGNDVAAVTASYQQLQQLYKSIAAEMPTWPVPGTKSAKNLHAGFERFLQTREKDAGKLAEIPKILQSQALRLNEKQQKIVDLLNQYEQTSLGPIGELTRLQQEFAREHNFILNPAPPAVPRPRFP